MPALIRHMEAADYAGALALWQSAEGVGLSEADREPAVLSFLVRNLGLSFVAREGGRIVGAVLCGHDGRRGYLYHLAVADSHRARGLGRALAERCIRALAEQGIQKAHVHVFARNAAARAFWERIGWTPRPDLVTFSKDTT